MILALYLAAINALTFGLYWLDKRAARRGGWRVSEYALLMSGFLGGTVAAILAQQLLRHKTRKTSFQLRFWALTVIQIVLLVTRPAPLEMLLKRLFA